MRRYWTVALLAVACGDVAGEKQDQDDGSDVCAGLEDPDGIGPRSPQPPRRGAPTPCLHSQPLVQDTDGQTPSGLERCEDGRIHSVAQVQCIANLSRTECRAYGGTGTVVGSCEPACGGDEWCTVINLSEEACACRAAVFDPVECEQGALLCSGVNSHCVSGNCDTDADCGQGYLCVPSMSSACSGVHIAGFWCETADDLCHIDETCDCDRSGSRICDRGFGGGTGHCDDPPTADICDT